LLWIYEGQSECIDVAIALAIGRVRHCGAALYFGTDLDGVPIADANPRALLSAWALGPALRVDNVPAYAPDPSAVACMLYNRPSKSLDFSAQRSISLTRKAPHPPYHRRWMGTDAHS
jgi:hypothetical protein